MTRTLDPTRVARAFRGWLGFALLNFEDLDEPPTNELVPAAGAFTTLDVDEFDARGGTAVVVVAGIRADAEGVDPTGELAPEGDDGLDA